MNKIPAPTRTSPVIKSHFSIGPPTRMFNPSSQVECAPGSFVSCGFGFRLSVDLKERVFKLGRHSLIGIEAENPIIFCLLGGEILLRRIPGPGAYKYAISKARCDFRGSIGAFCIDDDDFVRPREGLESL